MTAVNKYEDDDKVSHVKYNFFSSSNRVNFKAVIANLIHELFGTVSHAKVLYCLSARRLKV